MSVSQTLRSRPKIEEGIYFRGSFFGRERRVGGRNKQLAAFFSSFWVRERRTNPRLSSPLLWTAHFWHQQQQRPHKKRKGRNPSAHISTEKKKNPHSRVRAPRRRRRYLNHRHRKRRKKHLSTYFFGKKRGVTHLLKGRLCYVTWFPKKGKQISFHFLKKYFFLRVFSRGRYHHHPRGVPSHIMEGGSKRYVRTLGKV